MNGKIRIEDIFRHRLEVIRPTADDAAAVGRRYLATIEPTAKATVDLLVSQGVLKETIDTTKAFDNQFIGPTAPKM